MTDVQFHPLEGLTAAEKREQNCREFEGTGTPYLPVPGLKSLEKVRIGATEIPLSIIERVPVDANATIHEDVTIEMIRLEEGPGGTPVLLRNIKSNDGMWQAGMKIYVTGKWDSGAKVEPAK